MCWVVYHPKFLNSKGVLSKFPTKVGKNRMPKNKFPKVGNFIYKRCDNISTPSKKTCRQKKKTTTHYEVRLLHLGLGQSLQGCPHL